MADEFPFEISPMFEGERIRKDTMYVELAGPKSVGFELVKASDMNETEDNKFTLIGPDISEMEEGSRYPIAMVYKIAGELVEPDLESIVERRNHEFQNYIQGLMHLNQRDDVWLRISKDAIKKGLNSFEQIAQAIMMLFKNELPFIEKVEAIYITDQAEIEKQIDDARAVYKARDDRTKGLHDEDVDTFYGCTLCQSFAPTNVCVITPDRIALCGAINWFDGRAASKVDPEGPQFSIEKGEVIDAVAGEYSGVNELAKRMSSGEYDRIKLHSFFESPHTSCGCFEVVGFYIPEVDGIAWVDRDFAGTAPNGLQFSTMAGQTGGGKQVVGFLGVGVNYFRSPKFIAADGGWDRVVWMPNLLKQKVLDNIPQELRDKIATDENVNDIEALRDFLKKSEHPILERWESEEEEEDIQEEEEIKDNQPQYQQPPQYMPPQQMQYTPQQMPTGIMPSMMNAAQSGGIKITLKNAKVTIDKVYLKKIE